MPHMVIDGCKMKIDNSTFETMSKLAQGELQNSSEDEQVKDFLNFNQVEVKPKHTSRWKTNGTYDTKPLDPDYFKKYYQSKLKTPFTCPDCGKTIANKTNLSKHRNTKKCRNSQTHC